MTKPSLKIDTSAVSCPLKDIDVQDDDLSQYSSPNSFTHLNALIRSHSYFIVPRQGYTTEYEDKYTWKNLMDTRFSVNRL